MVCAEKGSPTLASSQNKKPSSSRSTKTFFERRGYVEVRTPLRVFSPGLDLYVDAIHIEQEKHFLRTSPEYHLKRLLAAGATRIFELGSCFRDDPVGTNHLREFTMLEWYRMSASSSELRTETAELVHYLALCLAPYLMNFEDAPRAETLAPPWREHRVEDLFHQYARLDIDRLGEEEFYENWATQIEPALQKHSPLFVTEWPLHAASLAKTCSHNLQRADRFEAYINGIELCNGFAELTDLNIQEKRLERELEVRKERELANHPIDKKFLDALADGIPPTSGNALGVERLLCMLTGTKDIR